MKYLKYDVKIPQNSILSNAVFQYIVHYLLETSNIKITHSPFLDKLEFIDMILLTF